MKFIRIRTIVAAAASAALLSMGMSSAAYADAEGSSTSSEPTIVSVRPEDGTRMTVEEVRALIPLERMVNAGKTDEEIKVYYPEATSAEIATIRNSPTVRPLITNPPCNNIEFYSIVRVDNVQYCFANAGFMSFYMGGIKMVCPGNNQGRVYYQTAANKYYFSPWRGPVNPLDTCYSFTELVNVWNVEIV